MNKAIKALTIALMGTTLVAMADTPVRKVTASGNDYTHKSSVAQRVVDTDTWKDVGTGKYRETLIHTQWIYSYFPEVEVKVQQSEQHPGRYRLVNPYANYPIEVIGGARQEGEFYLVFDTTDPDHVYVELSETDLILGLTGDDEPIVMWVWSPADDYRIQIGDDRWTTIADQDGYGGGKLVDGHVLFDPYQLTVIQEYPGTELDPEDRPVGKLATDEGFRIKLPSAPDIDVTPTFLNISEDNTKLIYNLQIDKDPEKVLVALVEGEYTEDMVEGIVDGTIASETITKTGSVDVELPYTSDGVWTLVCVPYWEGHASIPSHLTMEHNFSEDDWKKVGTASYTEGIMSSNDLTQWGEFVYSSCTYDVEVQEDAHNPGRVRMVNPYGPGYPYYDASIYDNTRNWYVILNATNPDKVEMEYCDGVGIDLGAGQMLLWGRTDRYRTKGMYTDEEIDAMGLYGSYKDDEITFPREAISICFLNNPTGAWYYANYEGKFKLKFQPGQITGPQPGGVSDLISDSENAPEVYYTLDGLKANAENLAPGMYVVRKGSKTYKKAVK
jgi:hypothetical protein